MEIQFQNSICPFITQSTFSEKKPSVFLENAVLKDDACKVTISKEGYESYRESIRNASDTVERKIEDEEAYKELLSKSIIEITGPTLAEFYSRFKKMNKETEESQGVCGATALAKNCLTVYTQMYDEIKRGYADGSREILVVDDKAENGFRRITEEEELAALDSAFDFHAQVVDGYVKYGMNLSEKIMDAVNRLHIEIESKKGMAVKRQEKHDRKVDEKADEKIDNLYEKLIVSTNAWKSRYSVGENNLTILFNQIFKENFQQ